MKKKILSPLSFSIFHGFPVVPRSLSLSPSICLSTPSRRSNKNIMILRVLKILPTEPFKVQNFFLSYDDILQFPPRKILNIHKGRKDVFFMGIWSSLKQGKKNGVGIDLMGIRSNLVWNSVRILKLSVEILKWIQQLWTEI